jgi:hypothetical protein
MTKIKDLVTVQVDSAFSLFPIDSERYELCIAAIDYLRTTYIGGPERPSPDRDERVKEFLAQIDSNFNTCASAYVATRIDPEGQYLPIVLDRAKRCEASLSVVDGLEITALWDRYDALQEVRGHLWVLFVLNLSKGSRAAPTRPKRTGGNP